MVASMSLRMTVHYSFLFYFLSFCSPSGFSGVTANFFPWMIVWMTNSQGKEAREDEREKMQRFLSISDRVLAHKVSFIHSYYILSSLPLSPVPYIS